MSADDHVRRHVIVHGDVQGVFFRDATREQADRHGVAGWVRNNPDGTVEAVFEGPADAVERMIEFSRAGPDRAGVERIECEEEPLEGLSGFQIR